MNNICIIPARSGSKRIKNKNIKDFNGRPIISYSIGAALNSKLFSTVMVSTDSHDIADIAKYYGASVPFLRSEVNSDDFATTADVLLEVIGSYKKNGINFDSACCLYPAAPLVTSEKIISCYERLINDGLDAIFPVVRFSSSIYRSYRFESGKLKMNWPENRNSRTQDLPHAYFDSGQFYLFNVKKFLINKDIVTESCGGYEVDEIESQDIDNQEDWRMAEIKYQIMQEKLK